jgi:hypothetical protein
MADWHTAETALVAASSVNNYATFDGGVNSVVLSSTVDCYVDFETPAATSRSLLVQADQAPFQIYFGKSTVKKVYAITGGGTGNLHILGIRE